MKRKAGLLPLSVTIVALALSQTACQKASTKQDVVAKEKDILMLYDFEDNTLPKSVNLIWSKANLTEQDNTSNKHALRVKMQSQDHAYTDVTFRPETPWDWSGYEDFSVAFDIANEGDVSTQVYLDIEDIDGAIYTRSTSIPVGLAKTYYSKMHGHDLSSPDNASDVELNLKSGLRSNPPTWTSKSEQFIWMWGKKNLNLKGIKRITLSVQSALRDKEITVDNVRLIANPKLDKKYLERISDQYGQNAKREFTGKIHSDEEMIAVRDAELKTLNGGEMMSDRSKYGGWKNGSKLKATGFFRTEKVDGKWTLVDPEGYMYFATGLDIIRLSNSSTMTGYDFKHSLVDARTSDEVTPEDSVGLNRVSNLAVPSRKEVSTVRSQMFEWLPDYNDPLGDHFGYRRAAHSGPLQRGETFSFYSANLERKYGEEYPQSYLDRWEKVTVDRMLNWGFTSLGNWTDPRFYDNERIPYFANGWIIGDFKTVSSGNDFWAPLPDVFDPEFENRAMLTAKTVAEEVKNSPWCVGVFIDNEKSFGRPENNESRYGIVLHTLRRDGKDVPTKAVFTERMKAKYKSIDALNRAWKKSIASWEAFDKGIDSSINTKPQVEDYSILLHAYAHKYFAVVNKSLKKHMPNHLYLGARFPDWGMPMEVIMASSKHVDVVSYNSYKEGLPQHKWEFLQEIDKPSIIGEFHIGAMDGGAYHPGLIHAANQEDRARMYKEYMQSVIDNPYFVGAHWFQYIDSPLTGRALDGENYNVGFVSVADVPYAPMVEAAKSLHKDLYSRRFK